MEIHSHLLFQRSKRLIFLSLWVLLFRLGVIFFLSHSISPFCTACTAINTFRFLFSQLFSSLSLLLFICRAFRFQTHTHQLDTYGVFLIKHLIAIAATTCTNFKTGQFPIQIGFLPFCTAYTTYMATWVAYSIWTPMHFGRGEKKKPNVRCWMFCVCVCVH